MTTITVEISDNSYTKVKEFLDEKYKEYSKDIKKKEIDNKIIYYTDKCEYEKFVTIITELLTNCIINLYENYLIDKIINDKYKCFNKMERDRVGQITMNLIYEDNDVVDRVIVIRRKLFVCEQLMKYLEINENIILEGFINFRLKNYLKDLEYIIEKAADIYEKEKEYKEFIDLLKYFVEVQEPKIDVIYLTLHKNGKFDICDKFKKDVSHLYLEEMKEDLLDNKFSNEDILLGALITISPKKIILNNSYKGLLESDIIKTIATIFKHRLLVGKW